MFVVIAFAALVIAAVNQAFSWNGKKSDRALAKAEATIAAMEAAPATAQVSEGAILPAVPVNVVRPTVTPTPTLAQALPVAAAYTVTVIVPEYFYVDVPGPEVEVTRLVEVPAVPLPTPTIQAGVMRLCVYVEGVSGVYINGVGIPGNACQTYGVGSPVNDFHLSVTGGDSYVEAAKAEGHSRDD